ncbi:hypothetical protein MRX96_004438 [Rhipicephalus microplus]
MPCHATLQDPPQAKPPSSSSCTACRLDTEVRPVDEEGDIARNDQKTRKRPTTGTERGAPTLQCSHAPERSATGRTTQRKRGGPAKNKKQELPEVQARQ